MNVIRLPQILPGELDLPAINYSLRMGEATLDWSQVREAAREHLSLLLAGLDLVEHSDIIGIDTISEDLAQEILHVLSPYENLPGSDGSNPTTLESAAGESEDSPLAGDTQQQTAIQPAPAASRTILQPLSPSAMRDELERLVLLDLFGPAGGPQEEVDESSVRDRYLVGMLAPRDQQILPEELDELAIPEEGSGEDGPNDEIAAPLT